MKKIVEQKNTGSKRLTREQFSRDGGEKELNSDPKMALLADYEKLKTQAKRGGFTREFLGEIKEFSQSVLKEERDGSFLNGEAARLNLKAFLAEVFYVFGETQLAADEVRQGNSVLHELYGYDYSTLDNKKSQSELDDELLLLSRQIRYAQAYVLVYLYRRHRYKEAEAALDKLQDILLREIHPKKPSEGILGVNKEWSAKINQHLGKAKRSAVLYAEAVQYYQQRCKRKQDDQGNLKLNPEAIQDDVRFSVYRSSLCRGLGFGFLTISTTENFHTALHQHIKPALAELYWVDKSDINKAYLELLACTAERCLAGGLSWSDGDTEKVEGSIYDDLRNVIKKLEDIKKNFEGVHKRYESRTCYQLGLAYLHLADKDGSYKKAEHEAKVIIELSEMEGDFEWVIYGYTLLSRIARRKGKLSSALEFANQAIEICDRQNLISPRTEALLTLGKALEAIGSEKIKKEDWWEGCKLLKQARTSFAEALTHNHTAHSSHLESTGLKVKSICLLHTARTYLEERNLKETERCITQWEAIEPYLDHKGVKQLGNDVQARFSELKNNRDFIIRSVDSDNNLNIVHWEHKLREHLVKKADERHPADYTQQAAALGVKRTHHYQLREKYMLPIRKRSSKK